MDATGLLAGSVGQGGQNQPKDVRIVQRLLNDWLAREKQTLLKVDGIAGPKTNGAIAAFQRKHLPVADSRVDPAGPTIQALFQSHLEGLLKMIDVSGISRYVSDSSVKSATFSDPALETVIQQYIAALKSDA